VQLRIEWSKPLPIKHSGHGVGYSIDANAFEQEPAIYIFGRKWGRSYEALYVGQTKKLRSRLMGHINNLSLMEHLRDAKTGQRVLIIGRPALRQGQQIAKVLDVAEKTLIRHFISEGHNLANKQGKRILMHALRSEGALPKSFMPSALHIEE
jgi:hypothetical protein